MPLTHIRKVEVGVSPDDEARMTLELTEEQINNLVSSDPEIVFLRLDIVQAWAKKIGVLDQLNELLEHTCTSNVDAIVTGCCMTVKITP